ncbi:MAG: adenylate/guanylate cyclase domain-containing protein [Flavobacteriales bacterium]|nr:adenylate/guanylate cyclase domain-containing protein [Flavobacteriales bacterium]
MAGVLSKAYKSLGNSDRALDMFELEDQMNDSLTNEEVQRGVLRQEYPSRMRNALWPIACNSPRKSTAGKGDPETEGRRKPRAACMVAIRRAPQRNRISKEKARSEELLLNILPAEVAQELKDKGEADARLIDEATILFTDFKGFTSISEQLTARELVEELNVCFKAFDNIITARGIEKIKTIGDAYMCAGGLPDPKTSSPLQVVHAALEMQQFMQQRKAERQALHKPAFDMRVGIHTGPVVAGIVGVRNSSDIWGYREHSGAHGTPGVGSEHQRKHYGKVKDTLGLHFAPRGKVVAKGKGEMEMWFVARV